MNTVKIAITRRSIEGREKFLQAIRSNKVGNHGELTFSLVSGESQIMKVIFAGWDFDFEARSGVLRWIIIG